MVPGEPQKGPILLSQGTIHTVSGETISSGSLLFDKGKIIAIGESIETPAGTRIIDLGGKHVYPGLISAASNIGLVEINAVRATRDYAEAGPINPNARAAAAINPDSEVIPVTRANGVLIAHVLPQAGGSLYGGESVVITLDGWTIEDMAIKSPAGIVARWPNSPTPRAFHPANKSDENETKAENNYQDQIRRLDKSLQDASAYIKAKENNSPGLKVNLKWEAMEAVLNKEIPLIIQASRAREIRDAVNWAATKGINFVLATGNDAWRVADLLKEKNVRVILAGANSLPSRRWESYDVAFTNAAKLHAKGIRFAMAYGAGGPNVSNERNLPYEAAKAAAHGLPREEALKSITLYPAQILGIDERVGSLEIGKDATLIITDGDPLDIRTQVSQAFIQGRAVDLSSRHTQLYEKYKKKYEP